MLYLAVSANVGVMVLTLSDFIESSVKRDASLVTFHVSRRHYPSNTQRANKTTYSIRPALAPVNPPNGAIDMGQVANPAVHNIRHTCSQFVHNFAAR